MSIKTNPNPFTFHMDDELNENLRKQSEASGVPMAKIIRRALRQYLAQPYSPLQLKYGSAEKGERGDVEL